MSAMSAMNTMPEASTTRMLHAKRTSTVATWVLLRGLTRETGHWGDFPALLRARRPDDTVVAIDLPGNGRLHGEASPTRIDATVEHCRAQLRAMSIDGPVHLLAMSMGAMVAVEWATRHPEALAGCVLVNTSLRPFSPWFHRLRPANYVALLGLALWPQLDRDRERTVLRLTSRHHVDDDIVIDAGTALRGAHPVSAANALRQLLAAARYRAPKLAPAVPMLVLTSARDGLVDSRCSQRLARHWGVEIQTHPTAGHDLPLDDGLWLVAVAVQWADLLR
ncbi:alpha/beta hydrolase [soil metagenome]